MRPEYCKKAVSPVAMFKLIRRFLFGTSPLFLLLSTSPFLFLSGTTPLFLLSATPFLFLLGATPFLFLLGAAAFLLLFGTPPRTRTATSVVGVWTHRYRANEIPVIEHRRIKSLRAAGDVPRHLDQVIRNRTVYPFNMVDPDKSGVVKTAGNFSTKNRQRIRVVIKFILIFQSARPTDRGDFGRAGCHGEIGRIGNLRIWLY